ncbi:MAG: YgiT-type zinc finger protein [Selenomonas sp.]|nr:YgiT-type zinc finger protein [Selenomonas sp.]
MCNACFDDNKIHTKTTFTVEYDNCVIVVRNVP